MRYVITVLVCWLWVGNLFGQKHDYNWITGYRGYNNFGGYLHTDNLGRAFYRGYYDNNLYAWSPTGPSTGSSIQITNSGNLVGGLAVAKCGCLAFYRDNQNNLRQLYWWNSWHDIGVVVGNGAVTDDIVIDEANSAVFFRAQDNSVYRYKWNYTSKNTSANALKKLGYDECANNVAGSLAISEDGEILYYRGTDDRVWYYFNDHDHEVGQPGSIETGQWYKTRLDNWKMASNGWILSDIKARGGKLFYPDQLLFLGLHKANWRYDADNPMVCPFPQEVTEFQSVSSYKTINEDDKVGTYESTISLNDGISVTVFPNPSTESFRFQIGLEKGKSDIHLTVLDLQGHIVFESSKMLIGGVNQVINWNSGGISSGIYFYKVETSDGKISSGKLIRQ